MTKKWTAAQEATVADRAERGFEPEELGPARPNPLRRPGRPSLSPEGGESKPLNARIPPDLLSAVQALATAAGVTTSEVARVALAALTARAAGHTEPARVFVLHGGDHKLVRRVTRHLSERGLEVVTVAHGADAPGRSVLERLDDRLRPADVAVVLMTPDGAGSRSPAGRHARQNAVFELGYLTGVLGRNHAFVLYDPSVGVPTDLDGVRYLDVTKPRVLQRLDEELARLRDDVPA